MPEINPQWNAKLRELYANFGDQERKVADFVYSHHSDFLDYSIMDIVEETDVSKSTIIRFCNKLGFSGLKDFKVHFYLTSFSPFALTDSIQIEFDDDFARIKDKIFSGCIESLMHTKAILDMIEVQKATDLLLSANTIYLYGYGGSAPNILYFVHKLMELGLKCQAFHDPQSTRLSISQIQKKDVVFAISCGGKSETVVEAVKWAKQLGVPSISITNCPNSPLGKLSDIVLENTGGVFQTGDFNTYSRMSQLATIDILFAFMIKKIGREKFFKITQLHYKHTKPGEYYNG
jgi:DNA-binding MurR/RpiR family transcriptional regulator